MVQQYDFVARVREEVAGLEQELAEPGVREGVQALAERMHLPPEVALSALYRSAKRSGYTLKLLLEEVNRQLDAEVEHEVRKQR
ncbi:MAG: hypothetical protein HY690_06710 [Chloroflexi bacterium]|nr:hypothetical protein [Chloroflexota bacterium]